jgi:hypothetical protein
MSQPPRYILSDADVVLEMTAQQARITEYVLRRAQVDKEFFADLAGSADPQATKMLRLTLAQVVNKLGEK